MKLEIYSVNAADFVRNLTGVINYDGHPYNALQAVQGARCSDQHDKPGQQWNGWTWEAHVDKEKRALLTIKDDGTLMDCNVPEKDLNPAAEPDPKRAPHVNLYVDSFGPHGERIPDEVGIAWDGRFSTVADSARAAAREALEADPLRNWKGWEWRVVIEDSLLPLLILDGNGNALLPEAYGDRSGRLMPNDKAERRERELAKLHKALTRLREVLSDPEGTNDREHDCAVALVEAAVGVFGEIG